MNFSKMIKEIVNKVPLEYMKSVQDMTENVNQFLFQVDFSSDHSVSKKEKQTCLNF